MTSPGLGPVVAHVFVATFIKVAVLTPGFAGAKPPPSPDVFSMVGVWLDGGPNCALGRPCFRGLPHASYQVFVDESWGPQPQAASLRAATSG